MRVGTALCSGLTGLRADPVTVEAFVSQGLPAFTLIGLPDTSLAEARERVRSAVTAAGYPWPQTRVTVNLAPASVPKHGTSYDLAIALAVLAAGRWLPRDLSDVLVLGELNLDGTVLPVTGLLPRLLDARDRGITKVVVPAGNLEEAQMVPGPDYVPVTDLADAVARLGGRPGRKMPVTRAGNTSAGKSVTGTPQPRVSRTGRASPKAVTHIPEPLHHAEPGEDCSSRGGDDISQNRPTTPQATRWQTGHPEVTDLSDIIGQEEAKRALEIAAAGGHHLLMTGPPGAGKSLLARALPGLLPPLDEAGRLEVASIRSICGTLPRFGMSRIPPFEAPHHTSSASALVGGGAGTAAPGAITRAHLGVLFLDEAPEFAAGALQALREPMETGEVVLARSKAVTVYPARFLLVMAANPCPCGNDWGDGHLCTCTVQQKRRYWSRLSGSLLDRIDIQIEVPPLSALPACGATGAESSAVVRERVKQARQIAHERFRQTGWASNAQASGTWLRGHTGRKALRPIQKGVSTHRLSMRGADRALRLAWTIADLAGRTSPGEDEVAEALMLRARRK